MSAAPQGDGFRPQLLRQPQVLDGAEALGLGETQHFGALHVYRKPFGLRVGGHFPDGPDQSGGAGLGPTQTRSLSV